MVALASKFYGLEGLKLETTFLFTLLFFGHIGWWDREEDDRKEGITGQPLNRPLICSSALWLYYDLVFTSYNAQIIFCYGCRYIVILCQSFLI